jgi:hypothetical protein
VNRAPTSVKGYIDEQAPEWQPTLKKRRGLLIAAPQIAL